MEIFKLFGSVFIDNDKANKSLDDTDEKGKGLAGTFGNLGGAATAVGGVLAGAVVAGAGAAAAGLGALFVAGDNLQKSMNSLQAQTGASEEEMASMEERLKEIYKNNYGESFQDISDTMAFAKQTTGAFGEELQYLTQDALMLRDTFGIDVNESLRGADALMEQFGSTGTEAMAFIAEATQKGLNTNDDLVDTIEEYSVYFKTAGLDAQDMFGILENASKAGVRNLDVVGDAFKEMVIRTKDGTKTTVDAYKSLGLNANQMMSDFAQGGEKGKQAYKTMMDALNAIEDPVEKNTIGVALFGTKFEDLEAGAIEAMSNMNGSITGSVDTLNEINEIKYDSLGEALQGIGRNVTMGIFEPFQEKVMPVVNEFANWISDKMPAIGDATSNAFTKIFDGAAIAYNYFQNNILPVLYVLYGYFQENILPILMSFYHMLMDNMPQIRAFIEEAISRSIAVFRQLWQFFVENLLPIISSFYKYIQDKMPQIRTIVQNVFSIFANVVRTAWDIIQNLLIPILFALWEFIEPTFPTIGKIVKGAFDTVISIVETATEVFEKVTGAIKKAVEWLTSWNDKEPKKKTIEVEEKRTGSKSSTSKYAVGTNYHTGGQAIVGEFGPELVELPVGSKVKTSNETRSLFTNQKPDERPIILQVSLDSEVIAQSSYKRISELQDHDKDRNNRA